MNAPERIWLLWPNSMIDNRYHASATDHTEEGGYPEYIRADLYEAQEAEIAELRRQLAEARDKALEEAATRLLLTVDKKYGDLRDYIRAIRALKGAA